MMKPVCVVSGAAGNLGLALVKTLQRHFFVEAIVRTEQSSSEKLHYNQLDLTDEDAAQKFVMNCVQKHKKIQAAALVAGGFEMGDLSDSNYTAIEKMLSLNFKTAYTLIRPVYQHMQTSGGGNIIVIGSKTAHQLETGGFAVAYTLSKAMLINLAQILNANRKESKVTIHVIVPGTIDTPDNRQSMPNADVSKWVTPETLADKIVELSASPFNLEAQTLHTFY
ncbi:NAD-dependent epimerase [Chryseotalea sanaruensis]|uniref:NAD-dependent epimerase n=1 Tax=Chryseotalea sanaruensis TaxID=2482724 RepID=A0A401U8Z0_9BACT|nr:SDR family NAD(P)-dependent oxidoreductase [Chryseotalea sanaruensis]GCC51368.1 NAD-dependent epimerase [Chryseotalea sanaruensis]